MTSCRCDQCVPGGGPHYWQQARHLVQERDGLWPWAPNSLDWGEVHQIYTDAGAPWVPDTHQRIHPNSLGWRVENGHVIRVDANGSQWLMGMLRRVGRGADMGPMSLAPVLEREWLPLPRMSAP